MNMTKFVIFSRLETILIVYNTEKYRPFQTHAGGYGSNAVARARDGIVFGGRYAFFHAWELKGFGRVGFMPLTAWL